MNRKNRNRVSPNHPSLHRPTGFSRTLHLIDVDNLLGDPLTTDRQRIDLVLGEYRHAAEYAAGDQAVLATCCNPEHALAIELSWPNACHRRRSGADGADLALI